MADPTKYEPHFNYSGWEAAGSKRPKPGAELDIDFANIARSIDETIDALKDLRRSDGKLKNGLVDMDAMEPGLKAEFQGYKDDAETARDQAQQARSGAETARDTARQWATSTNIVADNLKGARGYAQDAQKAATEILNEGMWVVSEDTISVTLGVGASLIISDPGPGPYDTVTLGVL